MSGPVRKWTDENLKDAVRSSVSFRDVLWNLGLSFGSTNYRRVKSKISELELTTEHFLGAGKRKSKRSVDEVFSFGSRVGDRTLRKFAKQLMKYECVLCGNIGEHLGNALQLQLDHINGNRADNRQENLRWLCPNCHSQTPTFSGKKRQ